MLPDENESFSSPHFSDSTSGNLPKVPCSDLGPRKRLGLWTLLPSLITFLFCTALPSIMLWYLLSRPAISPASEDLHLFHGAIIAAEGTQISASVSNSGETRVSTLYGLAFATIISHIVSITVPLLMGLLAYRVAARWVESCYQPDGEKVDIKSAMLTPSQYGIMLKIYGSSNLFSLYQSGRYLYRQKWTVMMKSPLLSSFFTLAFVLFLSYAISIVDLWLHTVSGTVVYSSISPVEDLASMPYGTTINTTICPYPGYMQLYYSYVNPEATLTPGGILPGQNCASYSNDFVLSLPQGPGWGDIMDTSILAASISAANNISNFRTTSIIESDNLAVLIPPSISSSSIYNFSASTYGISMSCQVPNCKLYDSNVQGVDGGPFGCMDFNPVYNASLYDLTSFLYDPTNMTQQRDWSNGTGNNPFGFFIQLPFDNIATGLETSGTDARNRTNGEPGWYYGTVTGSVVYLTQCTVTTYDVLLSNMNDTYTVVNKSMTDFNTTSALSSGFIEWMASTYLLPQIQDIMTSEITSTNFSSVLQTQLMLRSLALNAGILQEMPVNTSTQSIPSIASRYPIPPVATFLALLYIYAVVALGIVTWTCFLATDSVVVYSGTEKKTYSMLQMVQLRLTDPLAAVAEWFASTAHENTMNSLSEWRDGTFGEWKRTLEMDTLDMFDPDEQGSVAPQITRGIGGNIHFHLRKRSAVLDADDTEVEQSF